MTERPLTERMERILVALLEEDATPLGGRSMTGNALGQTLGFSHGMEGDRYSHNGKRMGAANRVNFAVSALKKRGLVGYAARNDGLSGGATRLTREGEAEAIRIRDRAVESEAVAPVRVTAATATASPSTAQCAHPADCDEIGNVCTYDDCPFGKKETTA